jgi:hypothetical protein
MLFVFVRTIAAPLRTTAAVLQTFLVLECHFEWIVDGSIRPIVKKNLLKELVYLEKYMRDLGRANVIDIMDDAAWQGETMYFESGDTMKWVGVLQGAELVWKTGDEPHPMIRMEEEGICSQSPQLVVKAWNR